MKVETKATEKVTKEEKVLTISESEFHDVLTKSVKEVIEGDQKVANDPMMLILLDVSYAHICSVIHHKLFNDEEEK